MLVVFLWPLEYCLEAVETEGLGKTRVAEGRVYRYDFRCVGVVGNFYNLKIKANSHILKEGHINNTGHLSLSRLDEQTRAFECLGVGTDNTTTAVKAPILKGHWRVWGGGGGEQQSTFECSCGGQLGVRMFGDIQH